MNPESVLSQFEILLPLAATWATEQEQRTVRDGVPLSEEETCDARAIGVQHPNRVRLLQVEVIPRPSQPQLKAACDAIEFFTPATRGLTLGYGIFVRSNCWGDKLLVAHELAHVAQYERLGGILPFLRKYLFEWLTIGYAASPLELEAVAAAARVCRERFFPVGSDRLAFRVQQSLIAAGGSKKMSRAAG